MGKRRERRADPDVAWSEEELRRHEEADEQPRRGFQYECARCAGRSG